MLVADDQVRLRRQGDRLLAASPESIRGRIEVRGVGVVGLKSIPEAELRLVVDLVNIGATERLPEPSRTLLLGVDLPLVQLAPFESSAPIKLALALAHAAST